MLQLLRIIVLLVFVSSNCFASLNAVQEEDGDPIVFPWKILLPNGSVTDNSDGTASITFGAGSIDGSGTTNELAYWSDADTLGSLAVATYPSLTELAYVKGVTSAIQTQLNAKESSTSNDFDPDRLAGDATDNNLVDEVIIDSAIARDSELHSAVTVSDSSEIDFSLTGQQVSGSLVASSIDETKLDVSVNASLDLADSALQAEVDGSTTNELQNIFQTVSTTSGTSPVADSTTDTLTLTAGTGITITGDSATDVVTIATTVVDTDTNTNASTICAGTTTYLDGEGNCDDISSVYAPALGADDNYVTDAEKVVIGNTSGTNTGDQTTITGNAGTATALASNGANCSAGNYPLGVDASGAVESCTAVPSASGWTDNGATVNATTATDNFVIGSTSATAGTSGAGVMVFFDGTAPSTSPTDTAQLYADAGTEYVTFMAHFNGTNDSTTFTDSSSNALTITANGNAKLKTATKKFGSASLYLDGTGDYASVADSNAWNIGTGNFTIQFWWRRIGNVESTLMEFGNSASDGLRLFWTGSSLEVKINNTNVVTGTIPSADGSFHHIEVTRSGSSVYLFIDGTQSGSTGSSSANITGGTAGLFIGSSYLGASIVPECYYDDFQILNGTALHTSNFTAPTVEASDSTALVELIVRDESGNTTTLSPHNFKGIPTEKRKQVEQESDGLGWTYHSKNGDKEITVDMFSAIRLLEKLSGEKLIYSNANIDTSVGDVTLKDLRDLKTKNSR